MGLDDDTEFDLEEFFVVRCPTTSFVLDFEVLFDDKEVSINKNDFTFVLDSEKIIFNKVFMALHGPPAENGQIQPYLTS